MAYYRRSYRSRYGRRFGQRGTLGARLRQALRKIRRQKAVLRRLPQRRRWFRPLRRR